MDFIPSKSKLDCNRRATVPVVVIPVSISISPNSQVYLAVPIKISNNWNITTQSELSNFFSAGY